MKLHLGCGNKLKEGYVNVDKFGSPDLKHDLEVFPWPWEDNSVTEILLEHVLEHLGQATEVFFSIMKEMYRVCQHEALIHIIVPHPRHDSFLNDPTHVRAITPKILELFSREKCDEYLKNNMPDTPLAHYLDVNFQMEKSVLHLAEPCMTQYNQKLISDQQLAQSLQNFNNVGESYTIILKVIK